MRRSVRELKRQEYPSRGTSSRAQLRTIERRRYTGRWTRHHSCSENGRSLRSREWAITSIRLPANSTLRGAALVQKRSSRCSSNYLKSSPDCVNCGGNRRMMRPQCCKVQREYPRVLARPAHITSPGCRYGQPTSNLERTGNRYGLDEKGRLHLGTRAPNAAFNRHGPDDDADPSGRGTPPAIWPPMIRAFLT